MPSKSSTLEPILRAKNMHMKRRILEGLAMLSFSMIVLVGCNPDSENNGDNLPPTDTIPVKGDWVRIYHPSDPDGLHPYNSRNIYATHIKEHIFMYLFDYEPQTLKHV